MTPRALPNPTSLFAMTEKEWLQQVRDAAGLWGWTTYHTHNSIRSEHGWPDLVLCRPPRLILAELKTDKGRTTTAQQEWLNRLSQCHGIEVHLWRPRDLDHVIATLKHERAA